MTADRSEALTLVNPYEAPLVTDAPAVAAHRRPASLRRNSVYMLFGNGIYAACQWGLLATLARLGTPSMVGQFVLALSVTAPVMVFFMLQLRGVQATDARREFRFGEYLALRLITTALAGTTFVGIALVWKNHDGIAPVIMATAIIACVDSLSDAFYGLLQRHERMNRIAQSMIVKGILSLAAFVMGLLITGWFLYGLFAVATVRIVVLLMFDLPNAARVIREQQEPADSVDANNSRLAPCWDAARLFKLARLAFPLGVVMLLLTLSGNIPRYFIEHYLDNSRDSSNLGIFGAIGYLSVVGTLAIGAIGESSSARLAQYYSQNRRSDFVGLLLRLVAIGTALGVAGGAVSLLIGPWVLALLYGPAYAAHADILVWTMAAAGVAYVASILGYAVSAARYFLAQIPLFTVVVFVTLVAGWQLIPLMGLRGAALTLMVSAVTQAFGAGIILTHAMRSQEPARGLELKSSDGQLQVQTP